MELSFFPQIYNITLKKKRKKREPRVSKHCDYKTPTLPWQKHRCCWSSSPWLTFRMVLHPMPALSLKWQQLVSGAFRVVILKVCRGKQSEKWVGWGTWERHGGPEWEVKIRGARRSGIIRSLCSLLKRLRRKPTDGPSTLRPYSTGCKQLPTNNWGLLQLNETNKWQWTQVYLKGNKCNNKGNKAWGLHSYLLVIVS